MGYYANGYGYFEVENKDTIVDAFAKAMVGIDDKTFNSEVSLWENDLVIDYNYEGNYHEEEVREVLDAIALLVKEGSMMEFRGEDDEHWAFVLECGNWVEKQGRIVYE